MDRRRFLMGSVAAAAAGVLPGPARAFGPADELRVARLRYDGPWRPHVGAGQVLAEEVRFRTSIAVRIDEMGIAMDDDRLATLPFAVLSGDRDFRLRDAERQRLSRWLELGGFLLIDNTGAAKPSATFDAAVRRELGAMFPRTPLERISPEHVVYRSFYRLDYPPGRAIRRPYMEGLQLGRRYAVVLSHNDLLGAFARDAGGRWTLPATPGGDNQREMAFRLGVNLVMYSMCLHYKDDQVHLDYLLHRRKWKIRRPE